MCPFRALDYTIENNIVSMYVSLASPICLPADQLLFLEQIIFEADLVSSWFIYERHESKKQCTAAVNSFAKQQV